jgi:hypothetical protein
MKGTNETESIEEEEKTKPKVPLSPEDERIMAFFGSFFGSEEAIEEDYGKIFLGRFWKAKFKVKKEKGKL